MRINYYQVGLGVDWFHPQSRGAVHLIPLNILEVSILVIVIVMMKKSLSLVLALNLSSRFPFWWCCFVIIHGWLDNGWWNWHLKTDSSSLVNWTGHLFMNFSHWFDCRPFLSFTCLTCCIPSWNLSLFLSLALCIIIPFALGVDAYICVRKDDDFILESHLKNRFLSCLSLVLMFFFSILEHHHQQ